MLTSIILSSMIALSPVQNNQITKSSFEFYDDMLTDCNTFTSDRLRNRCRSRATEYRDDWRRELEYRKDRIPDRKKPFWRFNFDIGK